MDFRTGKFFNALPLVTIGVLSYNYSQYIEDALNSLLTQTYPFIELIIIDDCSTESSTSEKIKSWISVNNIQCTFIQNKKNLGITKVSNMLIERAKGKYISLFATDDIMLPEKIERQVKILEEAGEEYGMCYANAATMDEEGENTGLCNPGMQIFEGNVLRPYVFGNFVYRIKQYSSIHNQINASNRERYCRDRILSNQQALKFIKDAEVRRQLKWKIAQYLKTLSAYNANSLNEILLFLLRKGYLYLCMKIFLIRLFSRVRGKVKYATIFL